MAAIEERGLGTPAIRNRRKRDGTGGLLRGNSGGEVLQTPGARRSYKDDSTGERLESTMIAISVQT